MTDLEDVINRFGDRVYWMPKGNGEQFYLSTNVRPWIQLTAVSLRQHLEDEGFFKCVTEFQTTKDEKETAKNFVAARERLFVRFLIYLRKSNYIAWVGELAGMESGYHEQNGFPFLVEQGMKLPVGVEGDCGFILQILEELFEDLEREYAQAWMQHGFLSFKYHRMSFGQALIIGGQSQDGKSLFQTQIISGLFGGRDGDATHHFSGRGNSHFNHELARAEHWMIDDKTGGIHFDRTGWGEKVKKFTAVPAMRIEAKGLNALNLILNRRLSVVMNLGAHNLALLPPDTEDLRDKVILLHSHKVKCLLPTIAENNALIKAQMPAYAWHMEHKYKAPAEVIGDPRFWVRAYQNHELSEGRRLTSTAHHIENLIQGYMQSMELREWKGSPSQLFTVLANYDRTQFLSLVKNPQGLGYQLTELVKSGTSIVKKKGAGDRSTFYKIENYLEASTGVTGAKVISGTF
jgi:hypothetical protein